VTIVEAYLVLAVKAQGIAGKDLWISKMKRHVVIVKVQVWSL